MIERTNSPLPGALRRAATAPIRPETYRNVLYLALSIPLGALYLPIAAPFVLVAVAAIVRDPVVVAVFAVAFLPTLAFALVVSLAFVPLERRITEAVLGVEITPRSELGGRGPLYALRTLLTDRGTWSALLYLPLRFFVGVASVVVVLVTFSTGVSMLFVPLYYDLPGLYVGVPTDRPIEFHPALYFGWDRLLVGFETVVRIDAWPVTTLGEALAVAVVGLGLCLVGVWLLNGLAWLSAWSARLALAGSFDVVSAWQRREG